MFLTSNFSLQFRLTDEAHLLAKTGDIAAASAHRHRKSAGRLSTERLRGGTILRVSAVRCAFGLRPPAQPVLPARMRFRFPPSSPDSARGTPSSGLALAGAPVIAAGQNFPCRELALASYQTRRSSDSHSLRDRVRFWLTAAWRLPHLPDSSHPVAPSSSPPAGVSGTGRTAEREGLRMATVKLPR